MAIHGMIDLETLGVEPDSVIITVGAIKFDPYTDVEPHSGLYLRCDIEEQSEQLGRTIAVSYTHLTLPTILLV